MIQEIFLLSYSKLPVTHKDADKLQRMARALKNQLRFLVKVRGSETANPFRHHNLEKFFQATFCECSLFSPPLLQMNKDFF